MAAPEVVRVGAVPGTFVFAPGRLAANGVQAEYIGRRVDHDAIKANTKVREDGVSVLKNIEACYPPDVEHNTTFRRAEGVHVLNALRAEMRMGNAAPLDKLTAEWAGLPWKDAPEAPTATASETTSAPRAGARRSTSDAKDS